MHILDHTTFSVVLQLVLDSLLTNEPFPVQLALAHRIYLSASVINRPHHMIQVLIGDVGFSSLKLLWILLRKVVLWLIIVQFFLYDFELACLFVEHELFSSKNHSFVGFDRLTAENVLSKFEVGESWL